MADFECLPAVEAGCRMPSARTIAQSDANYRTAAEVGSHALLLAMLRYGVKYGLPNLSHGQCWERLAKL